MEFCVLCVKLGNCNRLRPGSFAVVGIFDLIPKTVRYCSFCFFELLCFIFVLPQSDNDNLWSELHILDNVV